MSTKCCTLHPKNALYFHQALASFEICPLGFGGLLARPGCFAVSVSEFSCSLESWRVCLVTIKSALQISPYIHERYISCAPGFRGLLGTKGIVLSDVWVMECYCWCRNAIVGVVMLSEGLTFVFSIFSLAKIMFCSSGTWDFFLMAGSALCRRSHVEGWHNKDCPKGLSLGFFFPWGRL